MHKIFKILFAALVSIGFVECLSFCVYIIPLRSLWILYSLLRTHFGAASCVHAKSKCSGDDLCEIFMCEIFIASYGGYFWSRTDCSSRFFSHKVLIRNLSSNPSFFVSLTLHTTWAEIVGRVYFNKLNTSGGSFS